MKRVKAGELRKGDLLVGSGRTVSSTSRGAKTPAGKIEVRFVDRDKTFTYRLDTMIGVERST